LCQQILTKKDYYEILGLTKGRCTDDEIKKAYKKTSLKVHPDKNRYPKADEAFKKVNQAFVCLSNPDKRAIYDERGTEEEPIRPAYR
jgi:DnaJ homolog subfamily B member 12